MIQRLRVFAMLNIIRLLCASLFAASFLSDLLLWEPDQPMIWAYREERPPNLGDRLFRRVVVGSWGGSPAANTTSSMMGANTISIWGTSIRDPRQWLGSFVLLKMVLFLAHLRPPAAWMNTCFSAGSAWTAGCSRGY